MGTLAQRDEREKGKGRGRSPKRNAIKAGSAENAGAAIPKPKRFSRINELLRRIREGEREAKRLSKLLPGVKVEYEPTSGISSDAASVGHQFSVWLDSDVFECGLSYFDDRRAKSADLTVQLAANLAFQGERLNRAATELITRFKLDRNDVMEAVAYEYELDPSQGGDT